MQEAASTPLPGWPPDEEAVAAARAAQQQVIDDKLRARITELEQLPEGLPDVRSLSFLSCADVVSCADVSLTPAIPYYRAPRSVPALA